MAKAYRYDNHVETKGGGNYYSASRESSCDDLGIRGSTGSAILLDCGSEGLLHATTSSTAALQVNGLERPFFYIQYISNHFPPILSFRSSLM